MFFHFKTFEKAVILNFFLQYPQRTLNIVINDLDYNFLQKTPPLS